MLEIECNYPHANKKECMKDGISISIEEALGKASSRKYWIARLQIHRLDLWMGQLSG